MFADQLVAVEKERDALARLLEDATDELNKAMSRIARLEAERDLLQLRVQQLAERLAGEGRVLLALADRS